MFKKKLNNKKGFTLIELIVVIAILGILAAVAVPRLSGFQDNAKKKSDVATGKTIATVVATLVADQRITLPAAVTEQETLNVGAAAVNPAAAVAVNASEGYIASFLQSIPKTRTGGTVWTITISTAGDIKIFTGAVVDATAPTVAEYANQVFPVTGTNYQ